MGRWEHAVEEEGKRHLVGELGGINEECGGLACFSEVCPLLSGWRCGPKKAEGAVEAAPSPSVGPAAAPPCDQEQPME